MTPMQFTFWLKGYLEAAGEGPHVDAIRKALADVVDPPTYAAPTMPPNPPPYIPSSPIFQPNQCGPIDLSKVYCTNAEGTAQ